MIHTDLSQFALRRKPVARKPPPRDLPGRHRLDGAPRRQYERRRLVESSHSLATEKKTKRGPTIAGGMGTVGNRERNASYHAELMYIEAKTKDLETCYAARRGPGEEDDTLAEVCLDVLTMCARTKSPLQTTLESILPVFRALVFAPAAPPKDGAEDNRYFQYLPPALRAEKERARARVTYSRAATMPACSHSTSSMEISPSPESNPPTTLEGGNTLEMDTGESEEVGRWKARCAEQETALESMRIELMDAVRSLKGLQRQNPAAKRGQRDKALAVQALETKLYGGPMNVNGDGHVEGGAGEIILDPDTMTMDHWHDHKSQRQKTLEENLALQAELNIANAEIAVLKNKVKFLMG